MPLHALLHGRIAEPHSEKEGGRVHVSLGALPRGDFPRGDLPHGVLSRGGCAHAAPPNDVSESGVFSLGAQPCGFCPRDVLLPLLYHAHRGILTHDRIHPSKACLDKPCRVDLDHDAVRHNVAPRAVQLCVALDPAMYFPERFQLPLTR